MGRPPEPGHLAPRQPATVLGWTMRRLRLLSGETVTGLAAAYGRSASHISRVERGSAKPSLELVEFYEQRFEADGLLLSLLAIAEHQPEQEARRFAGHRPSLIRAIAGDSSSFVDDTIPNGTLMEPGTMFVKTWRIRNSGTVAWHGRQLERQGPLGGPGLLTSPTRHVPVPDSETGEIAEIQAVLQAPGYACTSIAYFKLVDCDGFLCFPDDYQLGLDVLVRVASQTPVIAVPTSVAEEREASKATAGRRSRRS